MKYQKAPAPKIQQLPDDSNYTMSNYRRGLDMQRERFKEAKFQRDLEGMVDALENIKSEIRSRMLSNNHEKQLEVIENIINYFRGKEKKYGVRTPQGLRVKYPSNFEIFMNRKLTQCFELLIAELDSLGLLK